ncbi:MAG TPA: HDOD domain-containing protein [Fimbriimonas sp.]|nr:HDOD domain-containing protein [Fimbriimonas sp.]
MRKLADIIKSASDLPSLPEVAFEVIRTADQSESSANTVAKVLSRDPSLSARVLRLANSAFYGLSREITTISEAVIVLGMRTTKSIALVAASFPWLHKSLKGTGVNPNLIWHHSIATAILSKNLAAQAKDIDQEHAFCVGLLHNIGTVALILTCEREFPHLLTQLKFDERPIDEIELELLGFNHATLGAELAQSWNFPRSYETSLRHFLRPSELPEFDLLTDIVHIANICVREKGVFDGVEHAKYFRDEEAFARFGMGAEQLAFWTQESLWQANESDDSLADAA